MSKTTFSFKKLVQAVNSISCFIMLIIVLFLLFKYEVFNNDTVKLEDKPVDPITANYNTSGLDDSEENLLIKYGFELFQNTPKYIGPENGKNEMAYAGNNLACTNCHLYAGTKKYSGMLIGVINRFPQYRGRENKIGTIEERIDGCMERSMNGKKIPKDSKEMKAFVSYLEWLSRYGPDDGKLDGLGYATFSIPNRPIDYEKGQSIFEAKCALCHGVNGDGVKSKDSPVYIYPPLWGSDSYNNGAGMTRVITAAQFIKTNMPFGATYENPILSDEECYDVAGYINQQERPVKENLEADFPDLTKKPVSAPYPPYADKFSVEQHQVGPFQPIMDFYKQRYGIVKKK